MSFRIFASEIDVELLSASSVAGPLISGFRRNLSRCSSGGISPINTNRRDSFFYIPFTIVEEKTCPRQYDGH